MIVSPEKECNIIIITFIASRAHLALIVCFHIKVIEKHVKKTPKKKSAELSFTQNPSGGRLDIFRWDAGTSGACRWCSEGPPVVSRTSQGAGSHQGSRGRLVQGRAFLFEAGEGVPVEGAVHRPAMVETPSQACRRT